MDDEPGLLAAARQIHDELGATELRDELAQLIWTAQQASADESRREAVDRIYELLARDQRTCRRFDELLPPTPDVARKGYESLAGDPHLADDNYDRLVCPQGDYAWPILDVADPTPRPAACPNDGSPLVFQAAGI